MSSSLAVFDAGLSIHMHQKAGRYYATLDGSALFGRGNSWDQALADLDGRYRDLSSFAGDSGLPIETLVVPRKPVGNGWRRPFMIAAFVIGAFALMMLPFSYALSTAVERTVRNLDLRGGGEFWRGIEQGLVEAAQPKNEITPEVKARTTEALRVLVTRAKPFVDEVRPLLGCAAGESK